MSRITFANSSHDNLYDHTSSLSDTAVLVADEGHPSVKGFGDFQRADMDITLQKYTFDINHCQKK